LLADTLPALAIPPQVADGPIVGAAVLLQLGTWSIIAIIVRSK